MNNLCEISCDGEYCDVCRLGSDALTELENLRVKQAFSSARLHKQKEVCIEIETYLKKAESIKKRAYETLGMELMEYNSYTEKIRELEGGGRYGKTKTV